MNPSPCFPATRSNPASVDSLDRASARRLSRGRSALFLIIACVQLGFLPLAGANEEAPLVGGLEDLIELELRMIDVAGQGVDATVALTSRGGSGSGSGVIVSQDGLVLTAAHVMAALTDEVIVILPDGTRLAAEKLGADFDRDAAMLRITDEVEFRYVELGDSSALRRNDWCVAIGHPGGYDPTRTPPLRLGRILSTGRFLVTDSAVVGGDSGGPLFDAGGRLIGIHSNIGMTLSQNRHVPIAVFSEQWDDMVEGKRSGSRFGTEMQRSGPDRPVMGVQLGSAGGNGVELLGVMKGSPADMSGLRAGDRILRVGDQRVRSAEQLVGTINRFEAGDEVTVVARRDGERKTHKVRLVRLDEIAPPDGRQDDGPPEDDATDKNGDEEEPDDQVSSAEQSADTDEDKLAELDKLIDQAFENRQQLRLSREQVENFGGQGRVARQLRERLNSLEPDQMRELLRGGLRAVSDPFFESVVKALEPVIEKGAGSVALVTVDGKSAALGTFVNDRGWMLTKDFETAEGDVAVSLGERVFQAELIKRFPRHDLALFKVRGGDFNPVAWRQDEPPLGAVLAAAGAENEPLGIGLVSVLSRPLAEIGHLGVGTEEADNGIRVAGVLPRSGAATAGLQRGDLIVSLNEAAVTDSVSFGASIRRMKAGDMVRLGIERDGDLMEVEAQLGERPGMGAGRNERFRRMNEMSGRMSERIDGFPMVLQHDIPLEPLLCGGPLLDLKGRCVGINVSRAGRVNTYAVPTAVVRQLLEEVDEDEITDAEMEAVRDLIREMRGSLDELESRLKQLEKR